MRSSHACGAAAPDFTLTCPGFRAARRRNGAGLLSFIIEDALIAEIGEPDLMESWRAARHLGAREAAEMSRQAGAHLAELLEAGLEAVDLTEAVTDAAVVFLLAMQRYGVSDPKRIPACSVMWHGQGAYERVLLGA